VVDLMMQQFHSSLMSSLRTWSRSSEQCVGISRSLQQHPAFSLADPHLVADPAFSLADSSRKIREKWRNVAKDWAMPSGGDVMNLSFGVIIDQLLSSTHRMAKSAGSTNRRVCTTRYTVSTLAGQWTGLKTLFCRRVASCSHTTRAVAMARLFPSRSAVHACCVWERAMPA
jgi:hypothetical protein